MRAFGDTAARAKVMIVDAARPSPFRPQGGNLAPGLEAVDPPAFARARPIRPRPARSRRTVQALMAPTPPRSPRCFARPASISATVFYPRPFAHPRAGLRAPVSPWHMSALSDQIVLVPADAVDDNAPPPQPLRQPRPMRDIGPDEAYALAIEQDTLNGYVGFVQAYPGHPLANRIWAIIRARREALAWMRALEMNTPPSYWTYLRRYPNGIYVFDAQRRLRRLGAAGPPPQDLAMVDFGDVPSPIPTNRCEYRGRLRTSAAIATPRVDRAAARLFRQSRASAAAARTGRHRLGSVAARRRAARGNAASAAGAASAAAGECQAGWSAAGCADRPACVPARTSPRPSDLVHAGGEPITAAARRYRPSRPGCSPGPAFNGPARRAARRLRQPANTEFATWQIVNRPPEPPAPVPGLHRPPPHPVVNRPPPLAAQQMVNRPVPPVVNWRLRHPLRTRLLPRLRRPQQVAAPPRPAAPHRRDQFRLRLPARQDLDARTASAG